jgi:hypothetical protein
MEMAGLPLNRLVLKVGAPVMLLKNFDPANGHTNGTRYVVEHVYKSGQCLKLRGITGKAKGKILNVPRITSTPSSSRNHPFTLHRKQFPIKLAFSCTVHKMQGSTCEKVAVRLSKPVFAHGALYVACSRVGHPDQLKFSLPDPEKKSTTLNIVWREVFGVLEPKLDYGLKERVQLTIRGRAYDRIPSAKKNHAAFFDACAQLIKKDNPRFAMTGLDLRSMISKRFRTDPELAEQLFDGKTPAEMFLDLENRPTFIEKWGWKKYGKYLQGRRSHPGGFEIEILNEILRENEEFRWVKKKNIPKDSLSYILIFKHK